MSFRFQEDVARTVPEDWIIVHCYKGDVEIGKFAYDIPFTDELHLQELEVYENHSGNNFSKDILNYVKRLASEKYGAKKVVAFIAQIRARSDFKRLIKMYEKNGFKVELSELDDATGVFNLM